LVLKYFDLFFTGIDYQRFMICGVCGNLQVGLTSKKGIYYNY